MTASTNQLGIPAKSLVLSYRTVVLRGVSLKDTTSPFDFMYSPYGKKGSVVHAISNAFFTGGVA